MSVSRERVGRVWQVQTYSFTLLHSGANDADMLEEDEVMLDIGYRMLDAGCWMLGVIGYAAASVVGVGAGLGVLTTVGRASMEVP